MRNKKQLLALIEKTNKTLAEEAKEKKLGTKASKRILAQLSSDKVLESKRMVLEFREFVRREIMPEGWTAKGAHHTTPMKMRRQLEVDGAALLGRNPMTTKRYMDTLTAKNGPFSQHGDYVFLNVNYLAPEENPYWLDVDDEDDEDLPEFLT